MPQVIPGPDIFGKPFWDAVHQKQLLLLHCTVCDKLQAPSTALPGLRIRRQGQTGWRQAEGYG